MTKPFEIRSLGSIRPNDNTKFMSPDGIGPLHLQRHTFEVFADQFAQTDGDEIIANLAVWPQDKFWTVEVSPRFKPRKRKPEVADCPKTPRSPMTSLERLFADDDSDAGDQ